MTGIDTDKFEDMVQVMQWTALTQAVILSGPEVNRGRLQEAVDNVAAKCNERWAEVANNEVIEFSADDLGIDLTAITDDVALSFAGFTALCLLGGVDGPHAAAAVLKEAIDELADAAVG